MTAVELKQVTVKRGGATLLDRVCAVIGVGGFVGLIGRNGAGKSTLLRAISATTSYRGEIRLFGQSPARRSRRQLAHLVSVIPQAPTTPRGMRVCDYVMLGRTAHIPRLAAESRSDRRIVAEALARLDLRALAERSIETLSGGEMQRAVIARALVQEAPLMLLDEPTSALDLGRQQEVLELVDELRAERQLTIVVALHDLALAGQYAQRLLLLDQGRLVADGAPNEIITAETIARYYGAKVDVFKGATAPVVVPRRGERCAL